MSVNSTLDANMKLMTTCSTLSMCPGPHAGPDAAYARAARGWTRARAARPLHGGRVQRQPLHHQQRPQQPRRHRAAGLPAQGEAGQADLVTTG